MSAVASRGHAAAVLTKLSPAEQPPRLGIELRSPVQDKLRGYVDANRVSDPARMVTPAMRVGHTVAICGAGPSLKHADFLGADAVWACNSAAPFLYWRMGRRVDVAIGIDQTDGLLREWANALIDVPYYLASSVDPALVQHLESHGRTVSFFHNHVGFMAGEFDYYCQTYPPTLMVGEGFTVVSRAIGLALWMGYERIDVYGADCAFSENDTAHANGEVATTAYHNPLIMAGEINGRTWRTRPDMLMDAVHLVRRVRQANGRIRLMGDTLPVALLGKDDATLDLVAERLLPGDPRNPSPPSES
jgi:uncharacterized Rossmann fold enzyme